MIHSHAEMNQISNYLHPNRLKILLLILYVIIRFLVIDAKVLKHRGKTEEHYPEK